MSTLNNNEAKKLFPPAKLIMGLILGAIILTQVGCADGPIRRFFRGGSCNSCQPPISHPPYSYGASLDSTSQGGLLGYDNGFGTQQTSSYIPSNLGNATINPSPGRSYTSGSYDGSVIPPGF
ncbi:MAG TPA: hypothetical protein PKD64_04860 [Pirellulaceae bacterium]|nr:hypothetical protein [Pirellulaceae bacterium]HMO91505.1 hypothetical protein [Pirellulaceae bacterium]HMP70978.1 hypothetical protein [Pirellulaceae bacterium]